MEQKQRSGTRSRWAALCLALLGFWASTGPASTAYAAGTAFLQWAAPTANTDGSPVATPLSYRVFWGCGAQTGYPASSGLIEEPSYTATGLPDGSLCRFVVAAIDRFGISSAHSNEATKLIPGPSLAPPGKPSVVITWAATPPGPDVTVSLGSFASSTNGTTDRTASVTIGANTKGILAFVVQALGGVDEVTGLALNDGSTTALVEVGSPAIISTGDTGAVYAYFLGSGLPAAGTYTLTATVSGSSNKRMGVYMLEGAADLEVVDFDDTLHAGAQTNPSRTLSLGGRTSFCALGGFMGGGATGDYTPLTDWDGTTNGFEQDQATNGTAVYSYNTIGSTDVTAGWTQASDEAAMVAVAVSEVVGGGGATSLPFVSRGARLSAYFR